MDNQILHIIPLQLRSLSFERNKRNKTGVIPQILDPTVLEIAYFDKSFYTKES